MKERFTFMCVGVQKAGTSTFHDLMKQHPALHLPKYKETHFFRDDEKYRKGLDFYFSFHFHPSEEGMLAEINPEYSYFPACAERISENLGTIKIIFILRNPVERAYSHYKMTQSRGLESLDFISALEKEATRLNTAFDHINFSYISRGKYISQIERFENTFGKENVKVFLFEELIQNPEAIVKSTIEFVGLPAFEFDYSTKSNVASEPNSKLVRDFVYKPNKLKKAIGKLIPSKALKDKIMVGLANMNKKPAASKPLSTELKRQVYDTYFREEVSALEQKLQKDLSSWKYGAS